MAKKAKSKFKWLRKPMEFIVGLAVAIWLDKLKDRYVPTILEWFNVPPPEAESSIMPFILKCACIAGIYMLNRAAYRLGKLISFRLVGYRVERVKPHIVPVLCAPAEYSRYLPVALPLLGSVLPKLVMTALFAMCVFMPPQSYLSWSIAAMAFVFTAVMLLSELVENSITAVKCAFDAQAHYEFWRGLRIAELAQKGVSLRQMPDELFSGDETGDRFPASDELLFLRAFEMLDFDRAREIAEGLDTDDIKDGDMRAKVICDLLYLEIMGENRSERVDELVSYDLYQFLERHSRLMPTYRTRFVLSLFWKEGLNYQDYERLFEKHAKKCACADEVKFERELMAMALDCAKSRGMTGD